MRKKEAKPNLTPEIRMDAYNSKNKLLGVSVVDEGKKFYFNFENMQAIFVKEKYHEEIEYFDLHRVDGKHIHFIRRVRKS